ncbi:MAG: alpha/beta hydrolase [Acidimicrobiia bacterium]|nr:alpha/beta hydrolase [Acidimicrobiia bacterium]
MVSVPAAAGLAWQQYRRAVRAVDAHPALAPYLPGFRRRIPTAWGSVTYRLVDGDPQRPPLVLVHGWGKTGDSAWWPIIAASSRTMLIVDLPGHGHSQLQKPFTFALAAESVERAVDDAGLCRPALVGHSMGGPVALTVLRRQGPGAFSSLLALATSAYWVRPRLRAMMALAPYVMAPGSPFLIRTERAELRQIPQLADQIAWAYTRRPLRALLDETAQALRRFDARSWTDLSLPPTTWVVATEDGVLAPEHQLASARHFGVPVVEVAAQHSMVVQSPDAVLGIFEGFDAPVTGSAGVA